MHWQITTASVAYGVLYVVQGKFWKWTSMHLISFELLFTFNEFLKHCDKMIKRRERERVKDLECPPFFFPSVFVSLEVFPTDSECRLIRIELLHCVEIITVIIQKVAFLFSNPDHLTYHPHISSLYVYSWID